MQQYVTQNRARPCHITSGKTGVWPIIMCLLAAVGFLCGDVHAQIDRLDKSTFIDGLAREGMSDLLLYLVKVDPPKDPAVAKQVEIAQYRILYHDPKLSDAQQNASLDKALVGYRQLISTFADHPLRPIWQTDLAELLLFENLLNRYQNATDYCEFGVPTQQQRSAYDQYMVQAYEQLANATDRFSVLQVELAKEADHVQKRVDTGLWFRMMDEYYHLRTQFFLALAAYHTANMPSGHRYYQTLGNNALVREQAKTISSERQALLELALEKIEGFAKDTSDPFGLRSRCLTLLSRVQAHLKQYDLQADTLRAIETLGGKKDADHLKARLGYVLALESQGQLGQALDQLGDLQNHPAVLGDLGTRLLVTDCQFQIGQRAAVKAPASQRAALLAKAYSVYQTLFDDAALGSKANDLKLYVYRRWVDALEKQTPANLPPQVALAVGWTARSEGQNLIADSQAARAAGDQSKAKLLATEAQPKLALALAVLTDLLKDKSASPATRAAAMLNQGYAILLSDTQDLEHVLNATKVWIDLANQYDTLAQGEQAITLTMAQLQPRHADPSTSALVSETYLRATTILFGKYPTSKAADDERYDYAVSTLLPAGEHEKAFALLADVPPTHRDYFLAGREQLYALLELVSSQQDETEKQKRADQLRKLAGTMSQAVGLASAEQKASANQTAGHCKLALGELWMLYDQPEQTVKLLAGFTDQYAQDEDLLRLGLGLRIVALASIGQLDATVAQAKQMMDAFPQQAADVIEQTLTGLDQRIDRLRKTAAQEIVDRKRRAMEQQAQNSAQAAARLGKLLYDWAAAQQFPDDEMLFYKLIYAKSLRLAGQTQQAADIIEPLAKTYGNDGQVIHHAGETYFALGGEANLVKAASYFDRLLMAYQEPPFPDLYWNAWMRRFQIMDKLGQGSQDIWLRVRGLRQLDANLGGLRYKTEIERLANKYAR